MDTIKSKMIEALEQYYGIVTTACKSIGLPRSTYYTWLKEDIDFRFAVDEIQEVAIDFVESKLIEKIRGIQMLGKSNGNGDDEDEDPTYTLPPSDTAIIFYLKTKGRKRGYQERTLLGSDSENPITQSPIVNVYNIAPPISESETEVDA